MYTQMRSMISLARTVTYLSGRCAAFMTRRLPHDNLPARRER